MRFYIPSYKRADSCITVDYLRGCGVQSSDIYVSTQTEQDYAQYLANYGGKCNVIYRSANSCAGNRNTCVLHARETGCCRFVLMDDDIQTIMSFLPKRDTPICEKNFMQFILGVESILDLGVLLVGLYSSSNNMYAFCSPKISRALITGAFMAFGTNAYLFDEEYTIKEDFELCLRIISNGAPVIRLNRFYAKVRTGNHGGCEQDYARGDSKRFAEKLLLIYPDLIKKSRRQGQIMLK